MVRVILISLSLILTTPVVAADATAAQAATPFFSWEYWGYGEGTSRSEIFRNFGLAFVALAGLGFGVWRALTAHLQAQASVRQAEIAQQGHITDRFSKAVEQLGSANVSVRIGGIYALKRIAQDSLGRDHISVMDVLTNFIRHSPYAMEQQAASDQKRLWNMYNERCSRDPEFEATNEPPKHPRLMDCPDIIAAIGTIQTRSKDQKSVEAKDKYSPNLRNANFSYLILNDIDLSGFDLNGANFEGTNTLGINLSNADLSGNDMQGNEFSDAIFSGSSLSGSQLAESNFMDAKLDNANLSEADLTNAYLCGADFTGANLTNATLMGADLRHTNFTDADLAGADLSRTDITSTNFSNANLANANLRGTHFAARMVDYAYFLDQFRADYPDLTFEAFQEMKDAPNLSMAFTHTGQPPRNLLDGIEPPPEKDSD